MKRTSLLLIALAGLVAALAAPTVAAESKEVTITGEGKCAKCAMHEGDKCQSVIQVQEDGKTVTYYLAQNKVNKNFHENVCTEAKKVTATGTVKEEDGKKVLTATKIELVK
jgi:hypothetical protein